MALTLMNKGHGVRQTRREARGDRKRQGGEKERKGGIYMSMEQKGKPHYSGALIKSCTGINNQTHTYTYKYKYTYTYTIPKNVSITQVGTPVRFLSGIIACGSIWCKRKKEGKNLGNHTISPPPQPQVPVLFLFATAVLI